MLASRTVVSLLTAPRIGFPVDDVTHTTLRALLSVRFTKKRVCNDTAGEAGGHGGDPAGERLLSAELQSHILPHGEGSQAEVGEVE